MLYLIGDVHGQCGGRTYVSLTDKFSPTVQLGDLDISPYHYLADVDSAQHRVLLGNHEDFPSAQEWPHFLPRWGSAVLGGLDCFFISGAFSIDRDLRLPGRDWFEEEELTREQAEQCFKDFNALPSRPQLLLSHTAPAFLSEILCREQGWTSYHASRTDQLLQAIWESESCKLPLWWFFGHHHVAREFKCGSFTFRCVAPGEVLQVTSSNGYKSVSPRTH